MIGQKVLMRCLNSSKCLVNSSKVYHQTRVLNKKLGEFSELPNESKNDQNLTKERRKVKLYPGFQSSVEDLNQQKFSNTKSQNNVLAKKVIEDFYGLNELEYEQTDLKIEDQKFEDSEEIRFDLDTAVKILSNQNVRDLCCIQVPQELNYADFMIIGTCLSDKHLNSAFISINQKYKHLKNRNTQKFLRRKLSKETKWCALDTGNIVIHLFLPEDREFYDLETLWSCGAEFDEKSISFAAHQTSIEQKLLVTEEIL